MTSSELIMKKKLSVLPQFLNILNNFFIKHGKKKSNFFILLNFLFKLKESNIIDCNFKSTDSAFLKFYNFINSIKDISLL